MMMTFFFLQFYLIMKERKGVLELRTSSVVAEQSYEKDSFVVYEVYKSRSLLFLLFSRFGSRIAVQSGGKLRNAGGRPPSWLSTASTALWSDTPYPFQTPFSKILKKGTQSRLGF